MQYDSGCNTATACMDGSWATLGSGHKQTMRTSCATQQKKPVVAASSYYSRGIAQLRKSPRCGPRRIRVLELHTPGLLIRGLASCGLAGDMPFMAEVFFISRRADVGCVLCSYYVRRLKPPAWDFERKRPSFVFAFAGPARAESDWTTIALTMSNSILSHAKSNTKSNAEKRSKHSIQAWYISPYP